jgi:hypothetical protein
MCVALYIAADSEPPLVSWDAAALGFNVVAVQDHERVVAKHLSKPYLRYLGAHTGCSCGFDYGQTSADTPAEVEEERLGRESVASLRRYLERMVESNGTVEIYACWEGDWEEPCDSRREVTPEYFGGESFEIRQRELLLVRAALPNSRPEADDRLPRCARSDARR